MLFTRRINPVKKKRGKLKNSCLDNKYLKKKNLGRIFWIGKKGRENLIGGNALKWNNDQRPNYTFNIYWIEKKIDFIPSFFSVAHAIKYKQMVFRTKL